MKKKILMSLGILLGLPNRIESKSICRSMVDHIASINSTWIMKSCCNAIPCTDSLLLSRFNQMQKEIGITKKILLFETPEKKSTDNVTAFYLSSLQTVCICTNRFSQLPSIMQSFHLYHELRHHLQSTTQDAQRSVEAYKQSNDMSEEQASEYDADMFALDRCLQLTNCSYCLQDIKKVKSASQTGKNYNASGYITAQGINAYLDKQPKKHFHTPCDDHRPS